MPASAKEQSLKYSVKIVNIIAASTAQFAKCILLHVQLRSFQLRENKQKLHIAYLTTWHNSIFGYKLRTIEAENP